jgi:NAD(P)-dependent dehydrogenase (short-subunit alcohol dehydrogenase family)
MGRLDGKVAVVTGGVSGIGQRTAEVFVAEGARVYIGDVNEDGIGAMVSRLGHNYVDGLKVDIRDEDAVSRMVAGCVKRFGRLDIGFNNAGVGHFSPIQDYPADEFRRIVDICLTGTMLCTKHESKEMIRAGRGGSIISIASLNAIQAAEGFAAYCSAKAGVAMLTKVAALELGRHAIRVNAIGPGLIETPATVGLRSLESVFNGFIENSPMGRAGQPEDVAQLAVYLASDASSLMTGQTLYIDGGESLKKYPELFPSFGIT